MEEEAPLPAYSFIHDVVASGPIAMAAMAVIFSAGILVLVWLGLVICRRRPFPVLIGTAVCLFLTGYLVYDREYLSLNLTLRDAQTVRNDCIGLIERRKALVTNDGPEMHVPIAELPASFVRLGAIAALVSNEAVQIRLYEDIWGSTRGYLYDPKRLDLATRYPTDVRPLWQRDFYQFRIRGE
ncbi:hypothetical protein ACXR0O_15555 [Verrucomicrobiota bacterium sgz303538]